MNFASTAAIALDVDRFAGTVADKRAEIVGGLLLMAIGITMLVEHLGVAEKLR